jgi:hypothetical protein
VTSYELTTSSLEIHLGDLERQYIVITWGLPSRIIGVGVLCMLITQENNEREIRAIHAIEEYGTTTDA